MKIKLTMNVNIPDGQFPSGSVIETSDEITARLIARGHAVEFIETATLSRDEVETATIKRKYQRK